MLKNLNRQTASLPQDKPVKVLQFGKGNFLRAFADWMVDLMNEKKAFNGAIQIVQVNSTDDDERFQKQQGLYHVVINGIRNGANVREIRLISAVDEVINPAAHPEAFFKSAENAALQVIISNTTEAGIRFDAGDEQNDGLPKTFPGKLTAFLFHRYTFFEGDPSKALLILPCELIDANGEALRQSVIQYATHWRLPDAFLQWITEHTLFCNTLVDRIVPGFPKDHIEEIWNDTGYRDELVVSAEPYHLWVIQPLVTPSFGIARMKAMFPLEDTGARVIYADDLAPYRTSKVRILNGAHTSMVAFAWLRGIRTVRDAVQDETVGPFIRETIEHEIIPTLDLPRAELLQFSNDVMERFQNPFVRHELSAIALNSISKFQVRVLPSMLEYHRRTGQLPSRLLTALAALIRFYKGEWNGEPTPRRDTPEVISFFAEAWATPESVVQKVLSNEELWKTDLTTIDGIVEAVQQQMTKL